VGDVGEVLEGQRVGVAMRGFSVSELASGIGQILELTSDNGIQKRCRSVAVERFSLQRGVEAYASIFDALAERIRSSPHPERAN
jgi:glycosyltransferase involved in cell wall biosynthesis